LGKYLFACRLCLLGDLSVKNKTLAYGERHFHKDEYRHLWWREYRNTTAPTCVQAFTLGFVVISKVRFILKQQRASIEVDFSDRVKVIYNPNNPKKSF